jgi:hypothetical protein
MFKQYFIIAALITGGIGMYSCARVGSPTGGLRDTIPPKLVYSEPDMYATNFNDPEIELVFDEYIQLNNINSELIVSPPVDEKPQVKLRNRSVLIDLKNELRDSVTYTLNFGESIVDNNESNPISGFEFVFSTGSHIDSFAVAGKLVNSFTHEPYENEIHVMLFDNLADSAPSTVLPAFITKTTEEGTFSINNVRSDTFRIFALQDANSNLKYDLPNEQIAFFDTAVFLSPSLFQFSDTIIVDSTLIPELPVDTIQPVLDTISLSDTTEIRKTYTFFTPLFMFEEEKDQQYLVEDNREDKHRLRLVFNKSLDTIHFDALNIEKENWYLKEYSVEKDTLDLWLADTVLAQNDSILLKVSHYGLDTVKNKVWITDTILFKTAQKKKPARRGRKGENEPSEESIPDLLNLNIRSGSVVDLNSNIRIQGSYPITSVDTGGIRFTWIEDSVHVGAPFQLVADTLPGRKFHLTTEWKEGTQYEIFIEPNTFKNIYHYPQDTIEMSFKTQSIDYYGTIIFDLKNVPHNIIIQFFDGENIVRQQIVDSDGIYTFNYMPPKEYRVKFIYDRNNNGEWDTGDYLNNIQPEQVDFFPEKISVRSNWEIEYDWDLKK